MQNRVIVYIDGFNLYFGIRDKGWRRLLWLDLRALAERLLREDQALVSVKYFTARVRGDNAKVQRQATFLQALETRGGLEIFYGRYQKQGKACRNCGHEWTEYEEKMSDVRIATEILVDAFTDQFDTAILVTADADIIPAIEVVRYRFPDKRVVLALPPQRDSYDLRKVADSVFRIGKGTLRKCQLPDRVAKPDGYVLVKPAEWT